MNDFLTPAEGVIEMLTTDYTDFTDRDRSMPSVVKSIRSLRRARLPQTYIGPGVSQAVLDGHLLNLRKERDPRTQQEDWVEGVENHLGLAKCYARLAATVAEGANAPLPGAFTAETIAQVRTGPNVSSGGMSSHHTPARLNLRNLAAFNALHRS